MLLQTQPVLMTPLCLVFMTRTAAEFLFRCSKFPIPSSKFQKEQSVQFNQDLFSFLEFAGCCKYCIGYLLIIYRQHKRLNKWQMSIKDTTIIPATHCLQNVGPISTRQRQPGSPVSPRITSRSSLASPQLGQGWNGSFSTATQGKSSSPFPWLKSGKHRVQLQGTSTTESL